MARTISPRGRTARARNRLISAMLWTGNPAPAVVFFVVTALIGYGRRERTTALWEGATR